MAKLSDDERAMLKKLQQKAEAPDAPPIGRSANFNIDLGDKEQVSLARRLGLIDADDDDDNDNDDNGDDGGGDDTPKRRGYFPDS